MTRVCLIAVCLLSLLSACGGEIEPGRSEKQSEPVKGLVWAKVALSPLSGAKTYVGTVESVDRGLIAARIDGRVSRILVTEGERVAAGQLLMTIDDNLAGDRLREAEAALAEARGQAAAAEARKDLAAKTAVRFQQLFKGEAVTAHEFDRVNAELEMARQGAESARASVRRAEAGVASARSAVGYTRVTAPYEGVVTVRSVEEGSTVMPGMPLLALERAGQYRVRAELPEGLAGQVAVGSVFRVAIPALGKDLDGTVSEVLPAADPRSRTFQVKLELTTSEPVSSGMFARVWSADTGDLALLAPMTAIVTRGQLTAVYVVDEGVLRYRLVKIGRTLGDRVEILSGLSEGEAVVVEGVGRAKNGARVEE